MANVLDISFRRAATEPLVDRAANGNLGRIQRIMQRARLWIAAVMQRIPRELPKEDTLRSTVHSATVGASVMQATPRELELQQKLEDVRDALRAAKSWSDEIIALERGQVLLRDLSIKYVREYETYSEDIQPLLVFVQGRRKLLERVREQKQQDPQKVWKQLSTLKHDWKQLALEIRQSYNKAVGGDGWTCPPERIKGIEERLTQLILLKQIKDPKWVPSTYHSGVLAAARAALTPTWGQQLRGLLLRIFSCLILCRKIDKETD